jgi:hypothetical protein
VLVAVSLVAGSSCAWKMYEGPRRSSSEIAVVETDGIVITRADQDVEGSYGKIALLPGLRVLRVRLDDEGHGMALYTSRSSKTSAPVCFVAQAGHTYTARPVDAEGTWRPEIIDQNTTGRVRTEGFADKNELCGEAADQYVVHHRPIVVPVIRP